MNTSAFEVTQLVLRERQSRDRGWYEEMAACYSDRLPYPYELVHRHRT
ncbi:hypothetical protein [Streptomyces sp. NPDC088847]